jgi:SAM-dependent methyltransferase
VDLDRRTLASIAAYDAHAADYQTALRLKRPVADLRRFADMAGRGALVLDVGCGPASDLRLLTDAGVVAVGVDLSAGVLAFARMLLPRQPLVRAPFHDLPFAAGTFAGLWMSSAFTHLPRDAWRPTFAYLRGLQHRGPVYFSCHHGSADLEPVADPALGTVWCSQATPDEVASLLRGHGLRDVRVELRPDPVVDRKRLWVVASGRV